jgi:aladin
MVEYQKEIRCMEWQPNSGTSLAVACQSGVALWTIDMQSTSIELPSWTAASSRDAAWVNILALPTHSSIDALSWSSCGRYLAACSSSDSALWIWDTVNETAIPLRRMERCLNLCTWSSNGDYIISTSLLSPSIRIWETQDFHSEHWSGARYCKVRLERRFRTFLPSSKMTFFFFQDGVLEPRRYDVTLFFLWSI